jgi:RNA polymerase sigma factor (sigma-70 family)
MDGASKVRSNSLHFRPGGFTVATRPSMPSIAPEELGRLYREHAPALRLYVWQLPGGDEDLVQEAFIKLAQQSPPPDRALPWLYQVVRNAALSASRGEARRRRRQNRVSASAVWFASADDGIDGRDAARLLAEVPLEQREVVVARIWGGLTFDEAAQLVGCSLATTHRRYQAGLAAIRERLESRWIQTLPAAKTI